MADSLVSVIIPVYNVERYIAQCLDSVVEQSYKNLEIILVNDGSSDRSLDICKQYAAVDDRIKIIDKKNEGLAVARQIGIDSARGIYLCLIDSDDVLCFDYVKKMYDTIIKNECDICVCGVTLLTDEHIELYKPHSSTYEARLLTDKDIENSYYQLSRYYVMSDSWNKMYRKEFLDRCNVKFTLPPQYNGTDLLFNHMILLHNPKIIGIKDNLYRYRLTPNSIVRRKKKHLENSFNYILLVLFEEIERMKKSDAVRIQVLAWYISAMKYATLDVVQEESVWLHSFDDVMSSLYRMTLMQKLKVFAVVQPKLKPFTVLLLCKNNVGLFVYYKARDIFRKYLKRSQSKVG